MATWNPCATSSNAPKRQELRHRAVAAMASAGNDIVMDHVLSEPWRLRDCLAFPPTEVRRLTRAVGARKPMAHGRFAPLPCRRDQSTPGIAVVHPVSSPRH
ncbi:phosphotransferase-like protein [Nocardia wallacei]|uniref:phosphotransferase-like protein n=1 Tax=Nocardia wallacei TaxID=480035 RepID=UPI003CC7DF37